MSIGSYKCKILLLWCSPGFGVVDIWLPVIKKLKEKENIKIYFIFPESSSLLLENKNSDLFNIAEQFSDKVVYRGYSGRWFVASTLIEARTEIKFSSLDRKIQIFSIRLLYGKGSKYFFLKVLGKYISIISKYFIRIKENFGNQVPYDFSLLNDVDGILYDIVKEGKSTNKELRNECKNILRFSMFHAMGAIWATPSFTCKKAIEKRSDVIVYSMSHLEESGYKKCFGILKENIIHAGIPRHDDDWIKFICNKAATVEGDLFDLFVFVIGRPASSLIPPERKKKTLRDMYNVICIEHQLKLVIKLHPKESLDGIDGDIYRDALGLENYGKNWVFSDKHPFVLGKKAIFCVSFFSGVVKDMLALNKPTIEYLDLSGLALHDNKESLRDECGKPVVQYRYANLVLGADSRKDLECHVEMILNHYKEVTFPLHLKYKEYYSPFNGSSKMVANDIYKRITI